MPRLKLAILDLYDGTPNQGMRCIQEIVNRFQDQMDWELFDVRGKAEVPGLDFDIYISTGGPGSPLDGDGHWDRQYFDWLQAVWERNQLPGVNKKYVFFICHSFQMAVKHFELAEVTKRQSKSFGTFICHQTDTGLKDPIFAGLPNPFYVADFRDWQCVQPDMERMDEMGAQILALEKIRPHVPLERALMAIRFSPEIVGVQFHPEADPDGMLEHFREPERKDSIVEDYGKSKYQRMIDHLKDEDKIALTHEIVIPSFLNQAISHLKREAVLV